MISSSLSLSFRRATPIFFFVLPTGRPTLRGGNRGGRMGRVLGLPRRAWNGETWCHNPKFGSLAPRVTILEMGVCFSFFFPTSGILGCRCSSMGLTLEYVSSVSLESLDWAFSSWSSSSSFRLRRCFQCCFFFFLPGPPLLTTVSLLFSDGPLLELEGGRPTFFFLTKL